MKKPVFANNEIYHVYNRGVDKRKVFSGESDYFRFVHNLFEFNNTAPAVNIYYKEDALNSYEVHEVELRKKVGARKPLIEILAFCLMPNHYHLLLQQKVEGGVVSFMQKLGTGYTNYFNTKYNRVGSLFQGRFKAVHVSRDSHFIHLPYYIHANPLDLAFPEWRTKTITDKEKAFQFLVKYRWSSLFDYLGIKNFPSVTERNFLLGMHGGTSSYKKDFLMWLSDISNQKEMAPGLTLE